MDITITNDETFLYKNPNHATNLNEMRLNNKLCDIIIKVKDKDIHAHKVILAANLKYFDMMLSNDYYRENKEGVINMESVEEIHMEAIVSYAYTGEMSLNEDNALGLLELANYLGEDGIRDACIEFLKKHLKTEEACQVYKLADDIDCLSLKNQAKTKILSNFEECSQTDDYFDLPFTAMIDMNTDRKSQPAETQEIYFHQLMKWIMRDVKTRSNQVQNYLYYFNIVKLKPGFLLEYLYENVVDRYDKHGIMREIMFHYYINKKNRVERPALILGSFLNRKFNYQCGNFRRGQCSKLEEVSYSYNDKYSQGTTLNDKLYYTTDNDHGKYINVFDPRSKLCSTLISSSNILRESAICACNSYLYLCGGYDKGSFISNQVLRYDPAMNSLKTLAPMENKRWGAAATFYQDCLYVVGGQNGRSLSSVEKFEIDSNEWTVLPSMCEARSEHAVAFLDGKLYACGGSNKNSVEVYEPSKNSWRHVTSMRKKRKDFLVIAHERKLIAIGGDSAGKATIEVYVPERDMWYLHCKIYNIVLMDLELKHPRGGLVSYDCVANYSYGINYSRPFRKTPVVSYDED